MVQPPRILKSNLLRVVIDTMDTRNLDLGLLVTLETLLAERNVTRAARRLNLSQPALSARLARLREALGDPLLIPGQRGMILTQRALELMQPLHEALEGVRRVVEQGAPFNPETLRATVVIAASDYVQYALLARYSVVLRAEAPDLHPANPAFLIHILNNERLGPGCAHTNAEALDLGVPQKCLSGHWRSQRIDRPLVELCKRHDFLHHITRGSQNRKVIRT
jgi:DNA-binding transcriptional LysR family regulator